jgi:hypothetical protein
MITALLFDAAARRTGRPGLRPDLVERGRLQMRKEAFNVIDNANVDVLLQERPFSEAVATGLVGVPLLTEEDLRNVTGDADEISGYQPGGRWWEFWQTQHGYYAMFPADDNPSLPVAVTAIVVSGISVQLRRFATGIVAAIGPNQAEAAAILPEECIHQSDVNIPGAPYRGRCVNSGCSGGCSPLVLVNPDDGLYLLAGCNC